LYSTGREDIRSWLSETIRPEWRNQTERLLDSVWSVSKASELHALSEGTAEELKLLRRTAQQQLQASQPMPELIRICNRLAKYAQ
jgi:hypothetical protein